MANLLSSLGVGNSGFSPLDIPNGLIYLDTDQLSDFYLDTALTLPATPTSPNAAGWYNRIGNGLNAIQSDMGKTPKDNEGYVNGYRALELDGTDDYNYIPHDNALNISNGQSFSAMFVSQMNVEISPHCYFSKTNIGDVVTNPGAPGFQIIYEYPSTVTSFDFQDDNGSADSLFFTDLIGGQPHIISFTFDWSVARLYLDGVLKDSANVSAFTGDFISDGPLMIGSNEALFKVFYRFILAFYMGKKLWTSVEHNNLGRYFAGRYGITWNNI